MLELSPVPDQRHSRVHSLAQNAKHSGDDVAEERHDRDFYGVGELPPRDARRAEGADFDMANVAEVYREYGELREAHARPMDPHSAHSADYEEWEDLFSESSEEPTKFVPGRHDPNYSPSYHPVVEERRQDGHVSHPLDDPDNREFWTLDDPAKVVSRLGRRHKH